MDSIGVRSLTVLTIIFHNTYVTFGHFLLSETYLNGRWSNVHVNNATMTAQLIGILGDDWVTASDDRY